MKATKNKEQDKTMNETTRRFARLVDLSAVQATSTEAGNPIQHYFRPRSALLDAFSQYVAAAAGDGRGDDWRAGRLSRRRACD